MSVEDKLRTRVRRYMLEQDVSMRTVARRAGIAASTMSEFLHGKSELSHAAVRRLIRAIDPYRGDLSVRAAQVFRSLKREAFTEAEIAVIGTNIVKMGEVLQASSANTGEQRRTS